MRLCCDLCSGLMAVGANAGEANQLIYFTVLFYSAMKALNEPGEASVKSFASHPLNRGTENH
jgi:hypothetical protein